MEKNKLNDMEIKYYITQYMLKHYPEKYYEETKSFFEEHKGQIDFRKVEFYEKFFELVEVLFDFLYKEIFSEKKVSSEKHFTNFFNTLNEYSSAYKYLTQDYVTYNNIYFTRNVPAILLTEKSFKTERDIEEYIIKFFEDENTPCIKELMDIMFATELIIRYVFFLSYLIIKMSLENKIKTSYIEFIQNYFIWMIHVFLSQTGVLKKNQKKCKKIVYYFKIVLQCLEVFSYNYILKNKIIEQNDLSSIISKIQKNIDKIKYDKDNHKKSIKRTINRISTKINKVIFKEEKINLAQYISYTSNTDSEIIVDKKVAYSLFFNLSIFIEYDKNVKKVFKGISIVPIIPEFKDKGLLSYLEVNYKEDINRHN